jgi:Asp/Glu/hydantoin racemase
MEKDIAFPQNTSSERQTENEASRLIEHIETALAAVAVRTGDPDSIEGAADRIESASRDLVSALRELARERSAAEGTS